MKTSTTNQIDTIRNGRFASPLLEDLRLSIVAMDCGFTHGMIEALNDEINQITNLDAVMEAMVETRNAMLAETAQ